MIPTKLDTVLLWAFPASGKSEILSFLRGLTDEERAMMHLGKFCEIDDYKKVAQLFTEDDRREDCGEERLYTRKQTREDGGFLSNRTWEMLGEYMVFEHERVLYTPRLYDTHTVLVECARGGAVDEDPLAHGYRMTIDQFPVYILERAAILYVKVSPETSRRKNREREDKENPLSQLGHAVPEIVMQRDYGRDDIADICVDGFVEAKGVRVPLQVLDNETVDLTSWIRDKSIYGMEAYQRGLRLHAALQASLDALYGRYAETHR